MKLQQQVIFVYKAFLFSSDWLLWGFKGNSCLPQVRWVEKIGTLLTFIWLTHSESFKGLLCVVILSCVCRVVMHMLLHSYWQVIAMCLVGLDNRFCLVNPTHKPGSVQLYVLWLADLWSEHLGLRVCCWVRACAVMGHQSWKSPSETSFLLSLDYRETRFKLKRITKRNVHAIWLWIPTVISH